MTPGRTILVTRPLVDARVVARRLRERGEKVLCAPIITIDPRPIRWRLPADARGLILTSAHGLRAFVRDHPRRDLTVFTVGRFSAAAAREAGFSRVDSADGDVEALGERIIDRWRPEDGALVHPAGSHTRGRLAQRLRAAGLSYHRRQCYRASTVVKLPAAIARALGRADLRAALFFSARSAGEFVRLVEEAALCDGLRGIEAWCLSPMVERALRPRDWKAIRTARIPDTDVLLEML